MSDSHESGKDNDPPEGTASLGGDLSPLKRKLVQDFQDRDYRESYAEEFLKTNVAGQIAAIREQRQWNQERLAKEVGTTQSAVSRLENVNYSAWNVKTLVKTAFALGTRLKISFETFSSLIEEVEALSRSNLQRPSFEEDAKILSWSATLAPTAIRKLEEAGDPRKWMQRAVAAWLEKNDWPEQRVTLTNWLRGYGLPPVGSEEEPYAWLLYGLPLGPDRPLSQQRFATLLSRLLDEQPDCNWRFEEREDALYNLFLVSAGLEWSETLAGPLDRVLDRVRDKPDNLSLKARDGLLAALIRAQADTRHESMWMEMIEKGKHGLLPGDEYAGLSGLKWLPGPRPGEPNLDAIALGLKLMAEIHLAKLPETKRDEEFRDLVEQVVTFYGGGVSIIDNLKRAARNLGLPRAFRIRLDDLIDRKVVIRLKSGAVVEAYSNEEGDARYIGVSTEPGLREEARRLAGELAKRAPKTGGRSWRYLYGRVQTELGSMGLAGSVERDLGGGLSNEQAQASELYVDEDVTEVQRQFPWGELCAVRLPGDFAFQI